MKKLSLAVLGISLLTAATSQAFVFCPEKLADAAGYKFYLARQIGEIERSQRYKTVNFKCQYHKDATSPIKDGVYIEGRILMQKLGHWTLFGTLDREADKYYWACYSSSKNRFDCPISQE